MKKNVINFIVLIIFLSFTSFFSCSKGDSSLVIEPNIAELIKISVVSLPNKTIYSLGEPLSLDGLSVEGVNSDNSRKILNITEANIRGFSSEKASDNLILTIAIDKLIATFIVKVLPIKVNSGVLTWVDPNITNLILPDFVTSIASKAFLGSTITDITLNEGLTSIGEKAFAWSDITRIIFPKTLNFIDKAAFYNCKNLEIIDLSQTSLTKITRETFVLNKKLAVVKLPISVKEIESQAFLVATSLKELMLPEGLLKIGNEAFRESGLVNLKLPNSICYMDQRAFFLSAELQRVETFGNVSVGGGEIEQCKMESSTFEHCPKLVHFEIPRGVKILGWNTISGSPSLESIVIPATVKEINFNAFGNAVFKTVTIEGSVPATANTISGAWQAFPYNIQSIIVPRGSVDIYKNAFGWNSYAKKIIE